MNADEAMQGGALKAMPILADAVAEGVAGRFVMEGSVAAECRRQAGAGVHYAGLHFAVEAVFEGPDERPRAGGAEGGHSWREPVEA